MTTTAVLVTGAGTTTALSVLKGLRNQEELAIRVIAVDMNPECSGRYFGDAFYQVPSASDPSFVPALLDICIKEQVKLLIPIVDYEFLPLAQAQERFAAAGCRVIISSPETVRICNAKDRTHEFFDLHGIPAPKLYNAAVVLQGAGDGVAFPLTIKPRLDGRGSINVYKLENAVDLAYWGPRVEDPLFEEYIDGREYTVDTLSDFTGRVVAAVPRERLEVKAGICYKGRTTRDPLLIDWATRIATLLGIVGPANIQCKVSSAGEIKFFEINPRFAATVPITVAAGVNMPLLLVKMALGARVDLVGTGFSEVTMLRYWNEVFVHDDPTAPDMRARVHAADGAIL